MNKIWLKDELNHFSVNDEHGWLTKGDLLGQPVNEHIKVSVWQGRTLSGFAYC